MNRFFVPPIAIAFALTLSLAAQAQSEKGDVKRGEQKIAMCIGCHGIPGYHSSFPELHKVPKLAGQNAKYLEAALKAYQGGERKHPTMQSLAASLSAQDIVDIAALYEQQGKVEGAAPLTARPSREPNAKVAEILKKSACAACHGENYSKPVSPDQPKLAGQHADYLYVSLKAYRDNTNATWGRSNGVMGGIVKNLSLGDLKEVSAYLESLQGELHTIPQNRFRQTAGK